MGMFITQPRRQGNESNGKKTHEEIELINSVYQGTIVQSLYKVQKPRCGAFELYG